MKGILIAVLVIAVLAGGLLTLRSTRQSGMPSDEVLKRAAKRARERPEEEED
ncbi:MAG: hypothetical protein ACLPV8_05880 [Steroidobacteraceae bacterium]